MRTYTKRCYILLWNARTKSEGGQFLSLQKGPEVTYHSNVLSTTAKLVCFIIPIHIYVYQCWKFGEVRSHVPYLMRYFGPVLDEIFGKICRFFPSCPRSYTNSRRNLWVSDRFLPKLHRMKKKYCHLTNVNRNCDIRIHFETPACWMKVI